MRGKVTKDTLRSALNKSLF